MKPRFPHPGSGFVSICNLSRSVFVVIIIWLFLPILFYYSYTTALLWARVYTYRYLHVLCTPILMAFGTSPGHDNRPAVIIMHIETISPTSFFSRLSCRYAEFLLTAFGQHNCYARKKRKENRFIYNIWEEIVYLLIL